MRRIQLFAAVLAASAVVGGGVPTLASAHTTKFRTATSFGYFSGNPDAILGEISSPKAACERRRKVKVFRRRSGADRLVGTARSNRGGQWVLERNRFRRARYYAKVVSKNIGSRGHRHICRSYRTSTLRFPGGTA